MQLIDAMSRIGGESAFVVLARAKALEAQGKDIIHLQIGEPDFPTPKHIVEAGRQALADGWTKYGPTQGLIQTREAIARYVSRTRGIEVGPERVCVVPGAKPIMYYAMTALLNGERPPSRRLPASLLVRKSTGIAPAKSVLQELGVSSTTDDLA